MAPDFILGGIMKSGTTLLHNLLRNHPQILMLDRKMSYSYFDDDRVFVNGFDWYQELFTPLKAKRTAGKVIGQTSADCAFNPQAVARIMNVLPNIKLIFVLRHPIDRSYSLYWHQYRSAKEYYNFEKAISLESERIKKNYHNFKHFSYLERSRYKRQFDNIFSLVPNENILLLPFEALTKNTLATINHCFEFLGVEPVSNLEDLNFDLIPRNSAHVPISHTVVVVSAYLQKLGLKRVGRRLINMLRVEQRPPAMSLTTRQLLEKELEEDIDFYEAIVKEYNEQKF